MGSKNADAGKARRRLIYSSTGQVLGLADGQLFVSPPLVNALRPVPTAAGAATDVPDEQGTPTRNEEDGYEA